MISQVSQVSVNGEKIIHLFCRTLHWTDEEAEANKLLKNMPFKEIEALKDFDMRLKSDKDYYHCVIFALQIRANRKSSVKAARSIISLIIHSKLCSKLSWKGVQRKDQADKKMAFKELQTCHLIFCITRNLFANLGLEEMSKIETSLSNWLAQTGCSLKSSTDR